MDRVLSHTVGQQVLYRELYTVRIIYTKSRMYVCMYVCTHLCMYSQHCLYKLGQQVLYIYIGSYCIILTVLCGIHMYV